MGEIEGRETWEARERGERLGGEAEAPAQLELRRVAGCGPVRMSIEGMGGNGSSRQRQQQVTRWYARSHGGMQGSNEHW